MTGVANRRRIGLEETLDASSSLLRTPENLSGNESSVVISEPRPSRSASLALTLLRIYGRFVSPALPRLCRFYPTCSVYASQAIAKYGLLRGSFKATVRLLKCHPFHPGGFDPVE